ncbi:MAG: energy transducer TonB [Pseudomonadota bacterium]
MRSVLKFSASAMVALAVVAGSATAQINNELYGEFNAAFDSGDVEAKRSAARSMAAAAFTDIDHPQAALIAYEAAWGFCRIEACSEGRDAASFALGLPSGEEYPVRAEREMLSAYIDWNGDPKRSTRRALDDALEAAEPVSASLVSVGIFSARMQSDAEDLRWSRLKESAGGMARHLEPVKSVLPRIWVEAALAEQVADFNHRQNRRVEIELAHVQGKFAEALIDADPAQIEALEPFRWRIEAWRAAVVAYFQSVPGSRRTPESEIDAVLAAYPDYPESSDAENIDAGEDDNRPFCKGDFDMSPKLRYPARQARRGQFGSVFAKLTVESGQVTDVEILASVPLEGFKERAKETVLQWTWIADDEQPDPDCRTSYSNLILPMVFSID